MSRDRPATAFASFSTLAPDFMAACYAAYEKLRAAPSMFWSDAEHAWIVHRHEDVAALLADPRFAVVELAEVVGALSARAGKNTADLRGVLEAVLFLRNPPAHGPARQFLVAVLTARPLSDHRLVIEAVASDLLAGLASGAPWDAARDYADLLPPLFMGRLLGLEDDLSRRLIATVSEVTKTFDRGRSLRFYERVSGTVAEALKPIGEAIADRRKKPREDGLSRMIALSDDRFHLDDQVLANRALFLLIAGAETTSALIGNAIAAVLDNAPFVGSTPAPVEAIVEETLRFDGPVQQISRIATADIMIAGQTIDAGDRVVLLTGAAHRDPSAYDTPEAFDPGRRTVRSLGFGVGLHFCVGATLARLEAEIALEALLAYAPRLVAPAARRWWQHRTLRRLEALPVTRGHGT